MKTRVIGRSPLVLPALLAVALSAPSALAEPPAAAGAPAEQPAAPAESPPEVPMKMYSKVELAGGIVITALSAVLVGLGTARAAGARIGEPAAPVTDITYATLGGLGIVTGIALIVRGSMSVPDLDAKPESARQIGPATQARDSGMQVGVSVGF